MSGPKVVRIVTREEVIALCQDYLAQLDAALRRWEAVGRRNDLLSDEVVEATRKRAAVLRALLGSDRLTELQKQIPDEIAYLNGDMERRLSEEASRKVAARVYGSRLAAMAQQSLESHALRQQALPEELRRELTAVVESQGADRARSEKALAAALNASQGATPALTPELRALAERLGCGERVKPLEDWLDANLPTSEAFALKAEKAIQELSMIAGADQAAPLAARCHVIAAEPPGRRRQMLADTLMLDASNALAAAKAAAEQLQRLELEAASLSTIDTPKAKDLARRIAAALGARDRRLAGQLAKELAIVTEEHRKALAARAQRSAIVTALQQLGYEVREGMETGAPHEGTMILRRAANAEMGVQVSGMQGGGRVQFRPVRFGPSGSAGDSQRDLDIETLWCADFEHLRERLDGQNGALRVEQARPVGEVPVLLVADDVQAGERRPEVRTPLKKRTRE